MRRFTRMSTRPIHHDIHQTGGWVRLVVSLLLLAAVAGVLALIGTERVSFYVVPSSSMEPTLMPNDRIVAYAAGEYRRGDVVVVRDPENPDAYLVKRIVGLPGDVVQVFDGALTVNDRIVHEPYLPEPIEYSLPPVTIEPDQVFLLGDNRNESDDGHLWRRGVPLDSIRGAVRYIYQPATRRGGGIAHPEAFASVSGGRANDTAAP